MKLHNLYPDGCRLALRNRVYLIEQKPVIRTLTIDVSYMTRNSQGECLTSKANRCQVGMGRLTRFRLALPYVGLVVKDGWVLRMCFTNQPLKTITDRIAWPLLPNVYAPSLQVCMGAVTWSRPIAPSCPVQMTNEGVAAFWGSVFTYFLANLSVEDGRVATFEAWERASNASPLFALEVPWPHYGTVDDLLVGYIEKEEKQDGSTIHPE